MWHKFRNIKKKYQVTANHINLTGAAPKTCDFYDELDDIFSNSDQITPWSLYSSKRGRENKPNEDDKSDSEVEIDPDGPEDKDVDDGNEDDLGQEGEQSQKKREKRWRKTWQKSKDKRTGTGQVMKEYMEQREAQNRELIDLVRESNKERNQMFSQLIGVLGNIANSQQNNKQWAKF